MRYLVLLILSFNLFADVLSYTDQNGKKHYVSDISKIPNEYRNQASSDLPKINKVPAKNWPAIPVNTISDSSKNVLLVTNVCPYCRMAEDYLKSKNIKFDKLDIEKDPKAQKLYLELGAGGVPILKTKDQVIRGYNPQSYEQAFKKRS